jgi:hypothetical protein
VRPPYDHSSSGAKAAPLISSKPNSVALAWAPAVKVLVVINMPRLGCACGRGLKSA